VRLIFTIDTEEPHADDFVIRDRHDLKRPDSILTFTNCVLRAKMDALEDRDLDMEMDLAITSLSDDEPSTYRWLAHLSLLKAEEIDGV
jgi:hypothetical protein